MTLKPTCVGSNVNLDPLIKEILQCHIRCRSAYVQRQRIKPSVQSSNQFRPHHLYIYYYNYYRYVEFVIIRISVFFIYIFLLVYVILLILQNHYPL